MSLSSGRTSQLGKSRSFSHDMATIDAHIMAMAMAIDAYGYGWRY